MCIPYISIVYASISSTRKGKRCDMTVMVMVMVTKRPPPTCTAYTQHDIRLNCLSASGVLVLGSFLRGFWSISTLKYYRNTAHHHHPLERDLSLYPSTSIPIDTHTPPHPQSHTPYSVHKHRIHIYISRKSNEKRCE